MERLFLFFENLCVQTFVLRLKVYVKDIEILVGGMGEGGERGSRMDRHFPFDKEEKIIKKVEEHKR